MRDSHGLFDYESRNISKKNYKTKYTGKIIRQQNQIDFISPNHRIEDLPGYNKEEFSTMAQIMQDPSKIYFIFYFSLQTVSILIMATTQLMKSLLTGSG